MLGLAYFLDRQWRKTDSVFWSFTFVFQNTLPVRKTSTPLSVANLMQNSPGTFLNPPTIKWFPKIVWTH